MVWRPRITHARGLGGFPPPSTTEKARGGPAEEWSFWHLHAGSEGLFCGVGGFLQTWPAISLHNFWRRTNVAAAVAFWGRNDASSRRRYTSSEQPRGASFDPFLHVSSAQQRPPPYVDGAMERVRNGVVRLFVFNGDREVLPVRAERSRGVFVGICSFGARPMPRARAAGKEEGQVLSDDFSVCTTGSHPFGDKVVVGAWICRKYTCF